MVPHVANEASRQHAYIIDNVLRTIKSRNALRDSVKGVIPHLLRESVGGLSQRLVLAQRGSRTTRVHGRR